MPLVQWKDEYEIGIRYVDHEHVGLIEVINVLGEHLDPARGVRAVLEALGEIRTLLAAHFGHEETIMRDRGYDSYVEHKADHDGLLQEIRVIAQEVAERPDADPRSRLGERLGRWFERHFQQFDSRLHAVTDGAASRE